MKPSATFSFIALATGTCCLFLIASGCTTHRVPASLSPRVAVVEIIGETRETPPNDYLRVSFVPPGTIVQTLSRPAALRAFVTASAFYTPALSLADFPAYSGLIDEDTKTLIAMRCRPSRPEAVDALLATWPNVFVAIRHDLPPNAGACAADTEDVRDQVLCFAMRYQDQPSDAVPPALARTFSYAAVAFDSKHTVLAQWLKENYGVYPAFSGLGLSVKDSYSLNSAPMTTQQILVKSISPEYIVKNVSLREAGCKCISVAPYTGRQHDPLDVDFIDLAGGDGFCKPVEKLALGKHH